jgi:hypothetical protein
MKLEFSSGAFLLGASKNSITICPLFFFDEQPYRFSRLAAAPVILGDPIFLPATT